MPAIDAFLKRAKASLHASKLAPAARVVRTLAADLVRLDLLKQASAMAYVSLLSLIPSLVAIFCILSLFSPLLGKDGSLLDDFRDWLLDNLTPDSSDATIAYLDNMLANLNLKTIGWSSFISVLVTLFTLLKQIEGALNRIWLVHKGRHPVTRFIYFWTFLTFGALMIGVAIGLTAGFDLEKLFSAEKDVSHANAWVSGVMAWFGGGLFFFALYKIVPNCRVASKNAAIGAGVASFFLNQGSRFYGMFVTQSASYKTLYGALAQLPIFLMWLYVCWIIILAGALLSWRMQEGFPTASDDMPLDGNDAPLDLLRNLKIRNAMPLMTLLAIARNFEDGTGRGVSAQELAHRLHMPPIWVLEALEVLEAVGFVVASRPAEAHGVASTSVNEPYFPAVPPNTLTIERILTALDAPLKGWLPHWHYELPVNVPNALNAIEGMDKDARARTTLAMLLASSVRNGKPSMPSVSSTAEN